MKALWLIGMMGSGKSAVGEVVARLSGLPFVDTDRLVEMQTGHPVVAVWELAGEDSFRALEKDQIASVVSDGVDCVVATGGGAILDRENRRSMRENGVVVWLTAGVDVLAGRLDIDGSRPLLDAENVTERLTQILDERTRWYAEAADFRLDTSGRNPDEVAREVMELWNAS